MGCVCKHSGIWLLTETYFTAEMQHLSPSSVSASRYHELLLTSSLFLLKQHNKADRLTNGFSFCLHFSNIRLQKMGCKRSK